MYTTHMHQMSGSYTTSSAYILTPHSHKSTLFAMENEPVRIGPPRAGSCNELAPPSICIVKGVDVELHD